MSVCVLILGAAGQVGRALQETAPRSTRVIANDLQQTDICDRDAVASAIEQERPTLVVNCAAFTQVDDAESQPDVAMAVNGVAPGVIAELASNAGARLIHISTDYVFDGRACVPYRPDDNVGPLNVYGVTKLEGERRVLAAAPSSVVVRTAWVHSGGGANFVKTAVRLLTSGKPMRVVDDQIGTPTRARHLAEALWRISERPSIEGVLHFTDAGVASWFDVALTVLEVLQESNTLGKGGSVSPARSVEFPRPARRPHFSVLDRHSSWDAIGYVPPHWRQGVIASTMELLNA